MIKKIENLTLHSIGMVAEHDKYRLLGDDLLITMSARALGKSFVQTMHPYRLDNARLMRVTGGHSHSLINMEQHELVKGSLLVVPKYSVLEIEEFDDLFDMQCFSFRDLDEEVTPQRVVHLHLDDDSWDLTEEYMHLLWHTASREPLSQKSIHHVQSALLAEIVHLNRELEGLVNGNLTRQEEIFYRFIALLNEYAAREHTIAFYANKLCLTPNHLGATIHAVSGRTVIQWVHRYIIQQAKLDLKFTTKPICEIADKLNFPSPSFFSMFFKRETGMTPGQFRERE